MSLPFQVRQSVARDIYGRQLASIVSGGRAHDQSVSLANDPNVYGKLQLDATIAHLIQIRKHMVAGSRWQMESATNRDVDKRAAEVMERVIDIGLKRFATGRFNLSDAVFTGSAFARITGEVKVLNLFGMPLNFWMPTELVDLDRRRFDKLYHRRGAGENEEVFVQWRMFDFVKNDWVNWDHPEWYVKHIYNDTEESLGHGTGLIDNMYFYWRAKEILWRAGLQGAERWALGFMVAKVDNARNASSGKTNQAIVSAFLRELEKQRSQHYLVIDSLDEVEVLPGPGQGHEIVQDMIQYCDRQLRLLVLGSNLPTEATGGGSYNLAEVQQGTTDTLIKYDRQILAESLSTDLLKLCWDLNRVPMIQMGLAEAEMPRLVILEDRKRDPLNTAEVTKMILDAGIPLKADEVYELLERTQPAPGDEIIVGPYSALVPSEAAEQILNGSAEINDSEGGEEDTEGELNGDDFPDKKEDKGPPKE